MYCPKCKTEASDASKFCGLCGGALDPMIHPSTSPPSEGSTNTEATQDGSLGAILADNDVVSLVNSFLWISVLDIGIEYIYKYYKIIPELSKDVSTPINGTILSLVFLGGFYLAFRFWGIAKASTIPFLIYLAWVALLVYTGFFAPDATMFQEFGLYLKSGHPHGWVLIVSIYEHFVAGLGFQTLIVLRILFLFNKQSEQK
jgi:hypothetical protein